MKSIEIYTDYISILYSLLVGVKNVKQVKLGVQHILADAISKNPSSHNQLKEL